MLQMLRMLKTQRMSPKSRPNCAQTRKTFPLFFWPKPTISGLCFARSCAFRRSAFARPHLQQIWRVRGCSLCSQRICCKCGRGFTIVWQIFGRYGGCVPKKWSCNLQGSGVDRIEWIGSQDYMPATYYVRGDSPPFVLRG